MSSPQPPMVQIEGAGGASLDDVIMEIRKIQSPPGGKTTAATKILVGVALILFVLQGASLLGTYGLVESAKEMHIKGDHLVSAESGEFVHTASAEFHISPDGVISRKCNKKDVNGSCPFNGNGTVKPIAVMENRIQRPLTSVIPDHLLAAMMKIKIISRDTVSTMHLNVLGVMRVVTPGSRCGTVVKFFTDIGEVSLDDNVMSVDANAAKKLSDSGFLLGANAVGSGRRLAEGTSSHGLFNYFENYNWKCDSLPEPKEFSRPYKIQVTQQHPCVANKCVSKYQSKDGDVLYKPGYVKKGHTLQSTYQAVETHTHFVKLTKLPNQPTLTLVGITDYLKGIHFTYQIDINGVAWFCSNATRNKDVNFTLADKYTPVYQGLESLDGVSVRKFVFVPKKDDAAVVVNFFDNAKTLLPHAVTFPNAKDMNVNIQSSVVNSYTKLTASDAQAFVNKYLAKKCAAEPLAQPIEPIKMKDNAYTEDTDLLLYHFEVFKSERNPSPSKALSAKYGHYWAEAMDMFLAGSVKGYNGHVQRDRNLTYPPSRRLGDSYNHSARRLMDVDQRRLFKAGVTIPIPLKNGCEVELSAGYDWGEEGVCVGIKGSNGCGADPPGWYVEGSVEGCTYDWSVKGKICIGYAWGFEKEITVGWKWFSKNFKVGCTLKAFACIEVATQFWGRRRRFMSVSGSLSAGIEGECEVGWVSASIGGELKVEFGPCGKTLDNRAKGTLSGEACCHIFHCDVCVGFDDIELFDSDIPDC